MSVTIDSLDIQIRSSAGSAKKNIEELAGALDRLNGSAKVTKIVNSLGKLNGALTNLRSSSGVMGQLSSMSKSLSSLASLPELTGLKSAVKELKKLPEIMGKLDTAEISQFASQMKLLASGLEPLAKQIDAIGKGFSQLPPQVSKCVTAVKRLDSANKSVAKSTKSHGEGLNGQSFNLLATYEHLSNVFSMIHGIQDAFTKVMNDAIQWDGIQFRFGRAFGEDAEMVLEYAEKVSKTLRINKQQFMQYSSLYASLLSGFGMAQEQVTTISVGLTELSYDIWAAYNDRYRTLEDASEAIRSAITGEIEPIRNAGIALTEASMQEYADAYDAATVAASDTVTALETIQQEADSAKAAVTDMLDTGISQGAMQATADMLGLGMSVEKMTEAQKSELRYAVMVNSALNQGIIGTYAREMNTAEGAVRTLTQQLKSLGQALGSLFLPILQKVLPWISAFVELLTEGLIALGRLFGIKFQEIQWGNAAGMKQTAEGADATANALGDAAKSAKAMKDYTMGFDELNIIDPTSASGGAGAGAGVPGVGGDSLGLDLETLWDDAVFASASKQIDELKQKIKDYANEHKLMLGVVGTVTGFLTFMKVLRGLNAILGITKSIDNLKTAFLKLKDASGFVKTFFAALKSGNSYLPTASTSFQGLANAVLKVVPVLKNALARIPSILATAVKAIPGWGWVAAAIITALTAAITLALTDKDFTDIGYKIGNWLGTALKDVAEWLGKFRGWVVAVGENILAGINAAWKWVRDEFDIDNVFELILVMFNPVAWITKIVPKMIEVGAEVLPGLWQGIKDGWDNFWGNIEEFIDGFVQGFKDALGIASPSKVFAEIGRFIIEGMLNGITEKWKALKQWFSTTVAPVFTREFWLSKWETVREGAINKLEEIKEGITDKVDGIFDWFSDNVAPKLTSDYWMRKLDGIKQGVMLKLTEVKKAATDKWNEVVNWFGSNVAPKFTTEYWVKKFSGLKDGFVQTIKNMLNAGIDLFNRFIGWVNDKMMFEWDAIEIMGQEVVPAGSVQLFTIPKIAGRFEDGGFLEDGLFTMNHGEIAGKFNNGKSVVANNQQIVDGIAAGVYEAVVAAMRTTSGSGNQNVNVYLDGRQITAAVEKRQSERGMQLVGNQLGYAF